MKTEVITAADFVASFLKLTGLLTEDHLQHFSFSLQEVLLEYYEHHWYPQAPWKGSAYRCLRVNHKMDPLMSKAACAAGITQNRLCSMLPKELTVWVNPNEVSYRIGENGSTCVLYEGSPPMSSRDFRRTCLV